MPSTFKGGKLPAQPARPHLKLSPVLRSLAPPPASSDWQDDRIQWPMYANDQVGCCTCAAVGHMVNQLTFYGSGREVEPTEQHVLAMYSAITGYVPGDESTDTGAYCQDVLAYWRQNVDEAWVVLDADGLSHAGAYFAGSASFYDLGQQFAALTGEANPIPAPQPQPTPTPVPTPPPSPTPAADPRLVQALDLMQAWAHDNGVG